MIGTITSAALLFIAGFWCGVAAQRKREPDPSLTEFAVETVRDMRRIHEQRKFVGSGASIHCERLWDASPIGVFMVSIEEMP